MTNAEDAAFAAVARLIIEEAREGELPLTRETRLLDLPAWDSIKTIGLILAVEQRFGFTIGAREVDTLERVGDVVSVVLAHGAQGGAGVASATCEAAD